MSSKDRFNEPVDIFTEDEWEDGDDAEQDWAPPKKIEQVYARPHILKDGRLR